MVIYHILDILFHLIHLSIIFFNLVGWGWKSTRRWNLYCLGITAFSWLGLGILLNYGLGYCFITDWHYQIKNHLGEKDLPPSYPEYILEKVFGFNFPSQVIESLTGAVFFIALVLSVILNLRQKFPKSGGDHRPNR